MKNTKLTKQKFIGILNEEGGLDRLFAHADDQTIAVAAEYALTLACNEYDAKACAFLCRAAKKKAVREKVAEFFDENRNLPSDMLLSENPKLRKNTARLIGALKDSGYAQMLISALERERVKMVIPSLILALGAVGGSEAHKFLSDYKVEPAKDESEIKHEREAREALSKALSLFESQAKHEFTDFCAFKSVQLICANHMAKYVADDLCAAGIKVISYSDTTVDIKESDLNKIYSVRSFRELLIPICKRAYWDCDICSLVKGALLSCHAPSNEPFRYRVEYRGGGDRREKIAEITKLLNCKELVNSVSDYEAEVRVYDDGGVKLKLFTYKDSRFDYRKQSLPASIHPSNAASVMSFAKEYLCNNAVVLDMCCGSGTMLFERSAVKAAKRLMGVDISQKAIDAAKENAKGICKNALFYRTDCKKFTLREQADEIISNLPFGNRVGTHENNAALYSAIFDNMEAWLKPGGIAVLYTMEYALIKKELLKHDCFILADVIKTEAGGLFPTVCILKKRV